MIRQDFLARSMRFVSLVWCRDTLVVIPQIVAELFGNDFLARI
jgi:hypothetical protein